MGLISSTKLSELPEKISSTSNDDYDRIFTFTLPYSGDAEVIILNDEGAPCVDAVELWDGKFIQRAAVLAADGKDCPFTNLLEETGHKQFRPKKFFIFTVIDLREYEKNDGTKIPYTKKALLVKAHMMDKFFRKKLMKVQDKQDTLRGASFEVSRGPKMSPSPPACGDQWDFDELVDLSEYEDVEVLTEDEILGLFETDPDKLVELADKWRDLVNEEEAVPAKYSN